MSTGARSGPPTLAHLRDGDRTLVMGVVNVTPDSFSDGGRWFTTSSAVAHGLQLLADGADLLDVGGESTRPNAPRVAVDEELSRVLPVVRELVAHGATVSVDTTRAVVAEQAVDAGVRHVWMHRSVDKGSVSATATALGRSHGITVIDGGCPLMFGAASDPGHRFMCRLFTLTGRVPRTV